jgi:predicted aspartyl protease
MAVSFPYSDVYNPPAPVVEVTIRARGEMVAQALLDSGADATMIPFSILRTIGARFARTHLMRGVLGNAITVELYFVELQIGSYKIPGVRAIAVESTEEVLIGRDALNQLIVTLDGIAGAVEIS